MPRPPPATPSPAALTASSFQKALALYPSLVEKVYKTKLKNDGKKVTEALERDRWRFDELPASVAQRKQKANGDDNGNVNQANVRIRDGKAATAKSKAAGNANDTALELSKDEVERLVQWKITHGHSRPFLPAMVRKNEPSAIQTQTALAFKELTLAASTTHRIKMDKALDHVCKLTGIGPATGTLILSVCDPDGIPFFQDEMFAWFFPDAGKLKYSAKEYQLLFEAVTPVLTRLDCKAVEMEKVAYVLGHMDLLGAEEREGLEESFEGRAEADPDSTTDAEPKEASSGDVRERDEDAARTRQEQTVANQTGKRTAEVKDDQIAAEAAPTPGPASARRGKKRSSKDEDDTNTETHTAKRRSQRNR